MLLLGHAMQQRVKRTFHYQSYLKIFFQLLPMHFSGELDLQGQRLKYLSVKRGKGYPCII